MTRDAVSRLGSVAKAVGAVACAVMAVFASGAASAHPGTASRLHPPVIEPGTRVPATPPDPADFVTAVDNPYFPLPVGAQWFYVGRSDAGTERDLVTVLPERRVVMGISAIVVRDTVRVHDEVTEDTYDWYAQDRDGNVWYLGEDTTTYRHGKVRGHGGSWEAGVDGARAGVVMPATPKVGDAYRQEYKSGDAEDIAEVTRLAMSVDVHAGRFPTVVTKEWSPLEPKVVEEKAYARGIGVVRERTLRGGSDRSQLVELLR
jgi:hypothetical protein